MEDDTKYLPDSKVPEIEPWDLQTLDPFELEQYLSDLEINKSPPEMRNEILPVVHTISNESYTINTPSPGIASNSNYVSNAGNQRGLGIESGNTSNSTDHQKTLTVLPDNCPFCISNTEPDSGETLTQDTLNSVDKTDCENVNIPFQCNSRTECLDTTSGPSSSDPASQKRHYAMDISPVAKVIFHSQRKLQTVENQTETKTGEVVAEEYKLPDSLVCKICERHFSSRFAVNHHLKTHSGEKPFSCEECGKLFTLSSSLKRHYRVHTGETPFECDECGMAFSRQFNLIKHRSLHSGELPFACGGCEKKFYQKLQLDSHLKVYSKKFPFDCTKCNESFQSECGRRMHLIAVHFTPFADSANELNIKN